MRSVSSRLINPRILILTLLLLLPRMVCSQEDENPDTLRRATEMETYYYWASRSSFQSGDGSQNLMFLPIRAIKFFRKFISPIDGSNCPMMPHCSQYGIEAVRHYGLIGIPMAADRIARCNHNTEDYFPVIVTLRDHYIAQIKYVDSPFPIYLKSKPKKRLRTLTK